MQNIGARITIAGRWLRLSSTLALGLPQAVGCGGSEPPTAGPMETATSAASRTSGPESTGTSVTTDVRPTTGDAASTTGDATSTTGDAASTGTSTAVDPTGGVDPSSSGSSGDCGPCPAELPHCVDGECVECDGDAACADGLCDPGSHTCMECAVDADCQDPTAPYCRDGDCVGCSEHSQCPSGACELDIGVCFPPRDSLILYSRAGQEDACLDHDCLSQDQACCSVQAALDRSLGPVPAHTHVIVRALKADVPDTVNVVPSEAMGAKHIAVIGVDRPEFADTLARPMFEVDHTPGKLFISGIVISSGEGMAGASCSGGTLMWIDDTSIRDVIRVGTNQARGVVMSSCDTVLRRSELVGNEGGVSASGPWTLRMVNTIIGDSPGGFEISTLGGPRLELLYSTVGDADGGLNSLIYCVGDTKSIVVRNSILVSSGAGDPPINCEGVPFTVDRSLVSSPALLGLGEGNLMVDDPAVELPFVQWGADLHLSGDGGPAAGAARWHGGDPRTDIDGGLRPAAPGAPDVAGADVP